MGDFCFPEATLEINLGKTLTLTLSHRMGEGRSIWFGPRRTYISCK